MERLTGSLAPLGDLASHTSSPLPSSRIEALVASMEATVPVDGGGGQESRGRPRP